jgi:Co/Zn/Cd efflux system component
MLSGCGGNNCSLDRLREPQRGTLYIVLGINAVMFFVIVVAAALYGKSTALLADSLETWEQEGVDFCLPMSESI